MISMYERTLSASDFQPICSYGRGPARSHARGRSWLLSIQKWRKFSPSKRVLVTVKEVKDLEIMEWGYRIFFSLQENRWASPGY